MEAISQFLYDIFGSFELATMFSGMIPLLEIKGAICFGIRNGLEVWQAYLFAYLGSTFMFLPIFLLLKPILNFLKKFKWFETFAKKCESYIEEKAQDAVDKRKNSKLSIDKIKFLGVFLFVAIPLPMTGVYMGTAIATFLNMPFLKSCLAVVVGNMLAGALITLLAVLCIEIIDYLLWGLLGLAVILLVVMIIKLKRAKIKDSDSEGAN